MATCTTNEPVFEEKMSESVSKLDVEVDGDDEENEDEREDELDELWKMRGSSVDMPSEYFQIHKLIKYSRNGSPTATLLSLCSLHHFDYTADVNQMAIFDGNALELLLNILETNELFCQVASLKLIRILSKFIKCRRQIIRLEGIQTLIQILDSRFSEVQSLSAEILSDLIVSRKAAHIVISNGGVQSLLTILAVKTLTESRSSISKRVSGPQIVNESVKWAAVALSSIARIRKSRRIFFDSHVVKLVAILLEMSMGNDILTPAVKIIQQCVNEEYFHSDVLVNGVVEHLIEILKKDGFVPLLTNCVNTITKCTERPEIRCLIREMDGLKCLLNILLRVKQSSSDDEKLLLAAVTGAIWKCSLDDVHNVTVFQHHKVVEHLLDVLILNNETEVARNAIGGLAECVTDAAQMTILIKKEALQRLISLLSSTDQQLLINICKLLNRCSENKAVIKIIREEDGIRHLWSLLKNSDPEVQCCAGRAIYSCLSRSQFITDLVRNFVGGLELVVDLLSSSHVDVLTSTCGVISAVAKNTDNLAIIIDNGAVAKLSNLTTYEISQKNGQLQHYLADAIANCCSIGGKVNVVAFGENKAVSPLVSWMKSEEDIVRDTAVKALAVLSTDKTNCLEMHHNGAVKLLLKLMDSKTEEVQENAATTLANIRKAVLMEKAFLADKVVT